MNNGNKPLSGDLNNEKKLINFSADWINLNVKRIGKSTPPSIEFLDSIFNLPHNDENASFYEGNSWPGSNYYVGFSFQYKCRQGEPVQIFSQDGVPLMRIVKIDQNRSRNKYEYQINFSGMFFDYNRLGFLNTRDFFKIFLKDISSNKIKHSISRLDVCADLKGVSVKEVFKPRGTKSLRKKHTIRAIDPKTGMPETIEYGKKKDTWMLRIYDKKKDAVFKKKERFYADYFYNSQVTRIEAELHSEECLKFLVTLDKCLDKDFLFSVYSELLYQKRRIKFPIVNFIKKELGHNKAALERRQHIPFPLEEAEYLKDVASRYRNACRRYGYTQEELLPKFLTLVRVSSNQNQFSDKTQAGYN